MKCISCGVKTVTGTTTDVTDTDSKLKHIQNPSPPGDTYERIRRKRIKRNAEFINHI